MSSEWIHTTLGEICHSQGGSIQTGPFGSQLHTSDYTECGTPVVMPTNIGSHGISDAGIARVGRDDVERLSQHRLEIGDIVFSRRGDVTKSALVTANEVGWLCGTGCLKVRTGIPKIASAKFLSYYLQLPETKDWLIRHAVGATMPNLNTGILSAVPITLPPIAIQFQISCFLSALDNRISLCTKTNKTLEAIAQAIFKSWFVDFDPVRAKMEGRQPEGMDEATAALFPDSFEESELGLIPIGWRALPFLETIDVIGGGTPKTSIPEYWEGDIPWFSVADAPLSTDIWVLETEKKISELGLRESSTKLLPEGTTIISARGTVGRLALTGIAMTMNQSCYGLRGKSGDRYHTFFNTKRLVNILKQHAHGSVFDTITRDTLKKVLVPYPQTTNCLTAFEAKTGPLMERMRLNVKSISTLTNLRDTLLPRLISGQLRLPEAQALVEENDP